MTTNLAIDDDLINEALTLGHFKTKEDNVVGCQWRSKTAYTWLQNSIAPPKNNFPKIIRI